MKKMKISIEFYVFEPSIFTYSNWSRFQVLPSTNSFDILKQFSQRRILPNKNRKNDHHHWILHIRISLGIKFYYEQPILQFGINFVQNKCLWSKPENANIISKFCIFKLLWVPNFTFLCFNFCTKFTQNEYFRSKTKKINIAIGKSYIQRVLLIIALRFPCGEGKIW